MEHQLLEAVLPLGAAHLEDLAVHQPLEVEQRLAVLLLSLVLSLLPVPAPGAQALQVLPALTVPHSEVWPDHQRHQLLARWEEGEEEEGLVLQDLEEGLVQDSDLHLLKVLEILALLIIHLGLIQPFQATDNPPQVSDSSKQEFQCSIQQRIKVQDILYTMTHNISGQID